MASPYPSFIFQDQIPASQMMAHAQAVNEGMRIQELGKARQAEGLFRIAQLQQQDRAQREKNALDRMLALSQIEQNRITNEFRDRELLQRGAISREGFQADRDVAKIQAGRLDPREAIQQERQRYDEALAKKEDLQDQALTREWQILRAEAEAEQAKLDAPMPGSGFLGFGRGDYNARLKENERTNAKLQDIKQRMTGIFNILAQRGKVPTPNRGGPLPSGTSEAPPLSSITTPATQPPVPNAFSLNVGQANLTPFDMRVRGLTPGQIVEQDGQRYRIGGEAPVIPAIPAQDPIESAIAQSLNVLGIDERQIMPVSRGGYSRRDVGTLVSLLVPRLNAAIQTLVSSRGAGMPDAQQRLATMRNLLSQLQSFAL